MKQEFIKISDRIDSTRKELMINIEEGHHDGIVPGVRTYRSGHYICFYYSVKGDESTDFGISSYKTKDSRITVPLQYSDEVITKGIACIHAEVLVRAEMPKPE